MPRQGLPGWRHWGSADDRDRAVSSGVPGSRITLAANAAIPDMLGVPVVALAVDGLIYLSYLFVSGGITFLEAVFGWAAVAVAARFSYHRRLTPRPAIH
jgi:hypothetical protein